MSIVLNAVRAKYPQYADTPDAELAKALVAKHPQYADGDPELRRLAGVSTVQQLAEDSDAVLTHPMFNPPAAPMESTTKGGAPLQTGNLPAFNLTDALTSTDEDTPTLMKSPAGYVAQNVLAPIGQAVARGGKVTLAATADVGQEFGGQGAPNLAAYMRDPALPLPYEQTLRGQKGIKSVPEKAAAGVVKMLPAVGVSGGLAMAGAPSAVAAGLPMIGDEQGNFDPTGALIAAGLPGVSSLGEQGVAKLLAKSPIQKVVVEVLSRNPLQLKTKVVQQLPGGFQLSNDTFRKYLEAGGGLLAANAYLAATQAPSIMALPPEQRKDAALDMAAGMLGQSVLGFAARQGPSETMRQLKPKLAEMWRRTDASNRLGEAPEQIAPGAPTPESPETVQAQTDLTANPNSTKGATHVTPGEKMPVVPPGMAVVPVPNGGGTVIVNPEKADPQTVAEQAAQGTHGQTLGMGSAEKPPGGDTVLQTKDPNGVPVQEEVVTPETLPAAQAAAEAAVPGGTSELKPAEQVISEREAERIAQRRKEIQDMIDWRKEQIAAKRKELEEIKTPSIRADVEKQIQYHEENIKQAEEFLASPEKMAGQTVFAPDPEKVKAQAAKRAAERELHRPWLNGWTIKELYDDPAQFPLPLLKREALRLGEDADIVKKANTREDVLALMHDNMMRHRMSAHTQPGDLPASLLPAKISPAPQTTPAPIPSAPPSAPDTTQAASDTGAGEPIYTVSGLRTFSPFVKGVTSQGGAKGQWEVDQWLLRHAIHQAVKLGHEDAEAKYRSLDPKNVSQADRDELNQYLFGQKEIPLYGGFKPGVASGPHVGNQIADYVREMLLQGNRLTPDIVQGKGMDLGMTAREAGEWGELGATEAAYVLAQNPDMTPREKFAALVSLYDRMPTNGERTVESKVHQQYSTPPPLAYAASVLADIGSGGRFAEPTAGHGMLSIGSPRSAKKFINELNPARRERLEAFFRNDPNVIITSNDAATPGFAEMLTEFQPDRVASNPPFGNVLAEDGSNRKFQIVNAGTSQKHTTVIDLAIALNTFNALTKDGKGFAIIGAKTGTPFAAFGTDAERCKDYGGALMLDFFTRFNVVDWFTVGGNLYKKMGAAWPVDVIIVHGKGATKPTKAGGMARPWMTPPRVIETWDELAKLIPQNESDNIESEPAGAGAGQAGGSVGGTHTGTGGATAGRPGTSAARPERPERTDAGSGSGGGSTAGPIESPNPTPAAPTSVAGDSNAGIGQGTPEPAGGVGAGGTVAGTPGAPGVGGKGPVVAGSGTAEPVKPDVAKPSAPPRGKPTVPVEGLPASLLVKYQGVSKGPSLNLVAPRNIATQMQTALQAVETEVGKPLDEYVAGRLGRDVATLHGQMSGAQIDAVALAIRNIERGSALITADETGVGKGRIVAALMQYAVLRGLVPVFVTAKKNLYADMAGRDLPALGNKDFKPFITDNDGYYEDGHGKEHKVRRTSAQTRELMEKTIATGKLPEGAHGVFTTYDQLKADRPPGFKETPKEKFARKNKRAERPDGPRWAMLRALAPRALFILDEAHLAAGLDSELNLKFSSVLPPANGIYYSSATFAKRPDNLGIYALGTLIKRSGLNHEQLAEALVKGGVPMQQALSSMLAESGELVRRQQDWTGVDMDFKSTSADPAREIEAADTYTSFVRDLMTLAKGINATTKALEDNENQVRPEEAEVAVEPITFGSRLFNLSNQYLLALRSEAIVREAVEHLKGGRKPFIALYNTMEGPLLDLRARKLPMNFNGILLREMQKMLKVKIHDPQAEGGEREVELQPEDMADGGAFYRQLEQQINGTDFSRFPISPIDYIKKELQAAGYKVGELTARDGEVDDSGAEIVINKREKQSRNKILKDYNDGNTDVIIVNGSGSTGLSAHADPRFKDQRQRVMVVGQPAPDINEFMQMMGRVMRSGQTSKPIFRVLSTALAAERRFQTMLRGKMTSLNANATAEGESKMTQSEGFADDIFNVVGDKVVFGVMQANEDLAKLIDLEVNSEDAEAFDGFARYATGRFVLLPNADAQRLWDEIVQDFKAEIEQLDEVGQNPLRANAEDLRAHTLEQTNLVEGTGDTFFDGPAVLEKVRVKPPKAPPTHGEAVQRATDNTLDAKARAQEFLKGSQAAEAERLATATARGATPEQLDRIRETFGRVRNIVALAWRTMGKTYGISLLGDGNSNFYGVSADLKLSAKAPSDFASASRQSVVFTCNTFKGRYTLPLSKMFEDDGNLSDMLVTFDDKAEAAELFDKTTENTAERYVVTGNLLRGWEAADNMTSSEGRPRVTIYTREDGSLNTGVLMPSNWTPDVAAGAVLIKDAVEFEAALRGGQSLRSLPTSSVHPVQVVQNRLAVPSSAAGKPLWGDPAFPGFFERQPEQLQNNFVGYIAPGRERAVFQFLQAKGVRLMVKPKEAAAMQGGGGAPARGGFVSGVSKRPGSVPVSVTYGGMKYVKPLALPELVRLVRELTGQVPSVRKIPSRGKMKTYGFFGDGMITFDPVIFKDPELAALVAAHEIGHLVDYLPHETLKRGNLLGHLLALRSWLRNTFGALNNTVLRDELLKLTMWWRPYNPATDPKAYVDYRRSAEELYADALSVMFNAPGEMEVRAPKFYKAFWDELNRRPAVRDSLFQIQDLLNKGMYATAADREQRLEENFAEGERRWKEAVAERERLATTFDGFWTRFWQETYWNFYPLEQRAKLAEKRGAKFAPGKDPRQFLDDLGYRDVQVMRWGRHVFEKVIQPLEAAGLSLVDAGKYLFNARILYGDRSDKANPDGITPAEAQLALLKMTLDLGLPKMTLLRDAIRILHEDVHALNKRAVACGAFNKTVFATKVEPNKDTYATFAVLDYLDDYIPPGIQAQIGTLKKTANPFQATILKSIGLINLIAYQEAKNKLVDFLGNHFPADLQRAPGEGRPPQRKGKGIFMRLENGRPVYYYTDPYIADAFDKTNPRTLEWFVRPMDTVFRKFIYPFFITYNPAFLYFMSPMRDLQRTTRNLPAGQAGYAVRQGGRILTHAAPVYGGGIVGGVVGGALGGPLGAVAGANAGGYVGAMVGNALGRRTSGMTREVQDRYMGQAGPLIREMEANFALGTPFDQVTRQHRDDFMADLLKRMRVMPDHELRGWYNSAIFTPVRGLLDSLELGGMTLDTLAKTGSYAALRAQGMHPRQTGHWVRNNAGLPNISKKGLMVRQIRAIWPFLNVFMQGWRADAKLATEPNTRAGWWMRYMMTNGLMRVFIALAATGLFGKLLKEYFDGISEYDKTNYLSVPVGHTTGGDFGRKTVYIRIPEDETSRLLGGLISKGIRAGGPDAVSLAGMLDFGLGQIPSVNPAVSVPKAWATYASGFNPTDTFKGRNIVPDRAWTAGGLDSLKPMAMWTLNQSGAPNFVRWNAETDSTYELTLSAIPGVNKFLKVSDQGLHEQQRAIQSDMAAAQAQQKLKMPAQVQSLEMEYWRLVKTKPELRTPVQEERLDELKTWYAKVYAPYWEDIQAAVEAKKESEAASMRKYLEKESQEFYRVKK